MTTTYTANKPPKNVPEAVKAKARKYFGLAFNNTSAHETISALEALRALETKHGFAYGPAKNLKMPDRPPVGAHVEAAPLSTPTTKGPRAKPAVKAAAAPKTTRPAPTGGPFKCTKCSASKPADGFRIINIKCENRSYRSHACKACEAAGSKARAAAAKAAATANGVA